MIIEVTLKDPDGVYESLDLLDDELRQAINYKWFEWQEYCTIIIDTDTMTATVKELEK